MSEYAGKQSKAASAYKPEAAAGPVPGKRTLVQEMPDVAPKRPGQRTPGDPRPAIEAFPAAARPTIQSLFGSHLAARGRDSEATASASTDATPSEVGSNDAAHDHGEDALDTLAYDIVQHRPLHDKLAFVPDQVIEPLVRQIGRTALIRLATDGARLPSVAPRHPPTLHSRARQLHSPGRP